MIFNDKYNLVLEFARENNPEFAKAYDAVVRKLPDAIVKRCKKCREFEKEINDVEYSLETYPDEGATELSIDYYDDDCSVVLYVEDITEKKLNGMGISDINENGYTSSDLLNLQTSIGRDEIEFSFEIIKTGEKFFKILMEKSINSVIEKQIIKEFTMSELLKKMDVKRNKR